MIILNSIGRNIQILDLNIFRVSKDNMICGFNLRFLGDQRSFSHVKSRYSKNFADLVLRASLIGRKKC